VNKLVSEVKVTEIDAEQDTELFLDEQDNAEKVTYTELSVGKKAWVVRISLLCTLIFLMTGNVVVALEINDPLIIYSTLMPIQTLSIFFIGWFFFKNTSKGQKVMFDDLISVIIPIYNQKALIAKVIDAVFKSSYKNIEVIAVDDGCSDGTSEILDQLKPKYPKLEVIHNSNGGKRRAVSISET
jgi:hyaluronan synthase